MHGHSPSPTAGTIPLLLVGFRKSPSSRATLRARFARARGAANPWAANVSKQSLGQIIGHPFDGSADDGQEAAFGPGENPAPGAESDLHFLLAWRNQDGPVQRGQEHGMIEIRQDRFHDLEQREKIDHAIDLVQRAA